MIQKETKTRTEEEERIEWLTKERIRIEKKLRQTNIVTRNKQYRELCIQKYYIDKEKEYLLTLINNNEWK